MYIYLNRWINRKELASKLDVSANFLTKQLNDANIETEPRALLSSEMVTEFFRVYKLNPHILEDIAIITDRPLYDEEECQKQHSKRRH